MTAKQRFSKPFAEGGTLWFNPDIFAPAKGLLGDNGKLASGGVGAPPLRCQGFVELTTEN